MAKHISCQDALASNDECEVNERGNRSRKRDLMDSDDESDGNEVGDGESSGEEYAGDSEDESGEEGAGRADSKFDPRLVAVSNALKRVEAPGVFAVSGVHAVFPLPAIVVDGLGPLPLPLTDSSAAALIEKCHLAPYGHREETIVDTEVRNTWEHAPPQFRIENPDWQPFIDGIVASSCVRLGIRPDVTVQAKLYKMLLYETGGKFDRHQDSEKENGMIGTLVVVLPCSFEGGELLVHDPSAAGAAEANGEAEPFVWDQNKEAPYKVTFAAFYGDCPHEVKTVTKGHRLCLTYNLVTTGATENVPRFIPNQNLYRTLKSALCDFFSQGEAKTVKKQRTGESGQSSSSAFNLTDPSTHRQSKLVYVLSHKYTHAGLSLRYLKNKDALVAECLAQFSEDSHGAFTLFLARIKFTHNWSGIEGCYQSPNSSTTKKEDFDGESEEEEEKQSEEEAESETDSSNRERNELLLELLSPWVTQAGEGIGAAEIEAPVGVWTSWLGRRIPTGDLVNEVSPAGFLRKHMRYDDRRDVEYTGNEGSTTERWYQSAALALVPLDLRYSLQCAGNPKVAAACWRKLAKSNPMRAIEATSAFAATPVPWSMSSSAGVALLDGVAELKSLKAIENVLLSVKTVEYDPKLRDLVASFELEDVCAMIERIVQAPRDASARSAVNVAASVLAGTSDPVAVQAILDTLKRVPSLIYMPPLPRGYGSGELRTELERSEEDVLPEEFVRVLQPAVDVPNSFIDGFVEVEKWTPDALALMVAPALQLLVRSRGGDCPDNLHPVVQRVVDALAGELPKLKNRLYENKRPIHWWLPWEQRVKIEAFFQSTDQTMHLDHLEYAKLTSESLLEDLTIEPRDEHTGDWLARKTAECPLYIHAQDQVEALKLLLQ